MKRIMVVALSALLAAPALAQGPAGPSTAANSARPAYDAAKGFIIRAAEQVSEADYAFKPTPEVRSFGQLIGHIANANYMICAIALGEQSPSRENIEQARTTKAALVEALKTSFGYCDRAYAMSDAQLLAQQANLFGQQMTRLGVLSFNAAHDYEHYGNIVTYMRLRGMTPPSSQPGN